jgi:2-amino-4-hydroxy-6-hydroxymethyldihydropteridine diphosphokinase
MNIAVVELGSNIDPEANIKEAKRLVAMAHEIVAESKFVMTEPVGFPDQPDFLNGAILVHTQADRDEFKQYLRQIEMVLGRRRRNFKYEPRTIDLDIIVWNGKIFNTEFYLRDFTQKAVLELLPDLEYNRDVKL